MSLSPGTAVDILRAAEDGSIQTSEVSALLTSMLNAFIVTSMVVMGITAFNSLTNPPMEEQKELLELARAI